VIVVFVPHRHPPTIFETTREGVILQASDTSEDSAHTQSIPPGTPGGEFETAWAILTKDLQSAQHFETVDEARTYYAEDRGLTLQQRVLIFTRLMRLGGQIAS
jgi:hypothetical protein